MDNAVLVWIYVDMQNSSNNHYVNGIATMCRPLYVAVRVDSLRACFLLVRTS